MFLFLFFPSSLVSVFSDSLAVPRLDCQSPKTDRSQVRQQEPTSTALTAPSSLTLSLSFG